MAVLTGDRVEPTCHRALVTRSDLDIDKLSTTSVDLGLAADWFEACCTSLSDEWHFSTVAQKGSGRVYKSISTLRKGRGGAIAAFFTNLPMDRVDETDQRTVMLSVGVDTVSLTIEHGSPDDDELFLEALDRLVDCVPFAQAAVGMGRDSALWAPTAVAGFCPDVRNEFGLVEHSPIMYFTDEQYQSLDREALSQVDPAMRRLEESGILRLEVAPFRDYDIEARDRNFEMIAPLRVRRTPLLARYSDSVSWERLSRVEAALVVLRNGSLESNDPALFPDWHPDKRYWRDGLTYDAWQASFDNQLHLTPELLAHVDRSWRGW